MPPSLNLPRTLCLYTVCRLLRARFNFNSRSPSGSKLALCPAVALRFLPNFCPLATYQGIRQPPTPLGLFVLDVHTYQGLNPGYSWETNFSSIHLVITRVLWSMCPYNRTIAFGWISIAHDSSNGLSRRWYNMRIFHCAKWSMRFFSFLLFLYSRNGELRPSIFLLLFKEDTLCVRKEGPLSLSFHPTTSVYIFMVSLAAHETCYW